MDYVDYINIKLANMSESELQDFSEQQNFAGFGTLLKAGKAMFRTLGTNKSAVTAAKNVFKHEKRLDKYLDKVYGGSAVAKGLGKGSPRVAKTSKSVANQPVNKIAKEVPKGQTEIKVAEQKAPNANTVESKVDTPAPTNNAPTSNLPEPNEAPFVKRNAENVAKTAGEDAAVATKSATKEAESVMSKFNSAKEAVEASPKIQKLDKKIFEAVKRGDVKGAANLRKVRAVEARKIEVAYHKAYSGPIRNIHEWGRDHKWISAPIGIAGAAAAGGVASAGAAGAAGLWGANKVADAVFD